VLVKSPDSIVEGCQFTYSSGNALQAGSDIGFWSEAGFADNLTLKDNHFDHSITGANELTGGSAALGTIYVGMVPPEGAKGFPNNFQNRNVTIQGNRIDNSFIYGIFVGNADGVKIIDNVIGQTFIRGSFDAGQFYSATPDSGIFIGRAKNAEISNNKVARGRIVKVAVTADRTCVKDSVHLANNALV
jgi:parallel beta-helix repeat protein